MRIAFFEDAGAIRLGPIALMRPVFELLCGRFCLRERLLLLRPEVEWGAFVRSYLAEVYREAHPGIPVNDGTWLAADRLLLLNGRWLPAPGALDDIRDDAVGMRDGTIVFLTVQGSDASAFARMPWEQAIQHVAESRRRVPAEGRLIEYPWDLVEHNREQLAVDFRAAAAGRWRSEVAGRRSEGSGAESLTSEVLTSEVLNRPSDFGPDVAVLGRGEDVFVDPTAAVEPFTVLDARQGPVTVDRGAVIQSFTRLEGPCYVGPQSQLFRANVRGGTTIGPHCRVGGEVEESILHGYVNTYHEGFLGHGYVCPWVNLGALTTNSDLKNDYSPVRVPLSGEMIDTGCRKVGCFIGDHTKTGLGSLFNTGSSVGVMCMVLPAGELLPKHVPSFSRLWHGELDDGLDLTQALETARTVMQRRGCELSGAQERLLRYLHDATQNERERAILRLRQKQHRRSAIREAS